MFTFIRAYPPVWWGPRGHARTGIVPRGTRGFPTPAFVSLPPRSSFELPSLPAALRARARALQSSAWREEDRQDPGAPPESVAQPVPHTRHPYLDLDSDVRSPGHTVMVAVSISIPCLYLYLGLGLDPGLGM